MKKLTLILFLGVIFMSCKYKSTYEDTKVKCVIDFSKNENKMYLFYDDDWTPEKIANGTVFGV